MFIYAAESNQIAKKGSLEEDKGLNWANNQKDRKRERETKTSKTESNQQNQKPVLRTEFEKPKVIGDFGALTAILVSVLLLVMHPVSDLYYYGGAILSLLAICFTMVSIIQSYNVLSTHRLPQFDKQGGDDRA